jgi:hypothetical protein
MVLEDIDSNGFDVCLPVSFGADSRERIGFFISLVGQVT